jgi:hypothetical protein
MMRSFTNNLARGRRLGWMVPELSRCYRPIIQTTRWKVTGRPAVLPNLQRNGERTFRW